VVGCGQRNRVDVLVVEDAADVLLDLRRGQVLVGENVLVVGANSAESGSHSVATSTFSSLA